MKRRRGGFTLIELLVVISIIGVLVGLLLPAINASREAGRRAQCQNNMHQIGIALTGFVNVHGSFPAAGVITELPLPLVKQNPGVPPIDVPRGQGIVSWHDPDCHPEPGEIPMYNWVVEILSFLDQQDLSNAWNKTRTSPSGGTMALAYYDGTTTEPGQISNLRISSTAMSILRCPDDMNSTVGNGNLSYVVNGGFSLWHALPIGWIGSPSDGESTPTSYDYSGLRLAQPQQGWSGNSAVASKLGVMFLEDYGPANAPASQPWNLKSSLPAITDGMSNTVLLSENTLAGAGPPSMYSKNVVTNWACPLANFCMFMGSDNICGSDGQCIGGQLQTNGVQDGPGWALANRQGTYENINYGRYLSIKGSFPFSNSGHPGICNMLFCDGAVRPIRETIDGTVYAKMLTRAGGRLPGYARQLPLSQDAFTN